MFRSVRCNDSSNLLKLKSRLIWLHYSSVVQVLCIHWLTSLNRPTSFRASITALSTRLDASTHNIELADWRSLRAGPGRAVTSPKARKPVKRRDGGGSSESLQYGALDRIAERRTAQCVMQSVLNDFISLTFHMLNSNTDGPDVLNTDTVPRSPTTKRCRKVPTHSNPIAEKIVPQMKAGVRSLDPSSLSCVPAWTKMPSA